MTKKAEPDKLAQDAKAAREAGMTYGKWKAMQSPVNVVPSSKRKGIKKICLHCGKEFYQTSAIEKKYCDENCRNYYYQNRVREERKKANGQ